MQGWSFILHKHAENDQHVGLELFEDPQGESQIWNIPRDGIPSDHEFRAFRIFSLYHLFDSESVHLNTNLMTAEGIMAWVHLHIYIAGHEIQFSSFDPPRILTPRSLTICPTQPSLIVSILSAMLSSYTDPLPFQTLIEHFWTSHRSMACESCPFRWQGLSCCFARGRQ